MSEGGALKALIGLRIAIGTASWLTPRVAGKLFGLDAKANPQSPYLARLFGARDIALGVGAGVLRAVELDINPDWVAGYLYEHHPGGPTGVPLVPEQLGISGKFLEPYSRDFLAVIANR